MQINTGSTTLMVHFRRLHLPPAYQTTRGKPQILLTAPATGQEITFLSHSRRRPCESDLNKVVFPLLDTRAVVACRPRPWRADGAGLDAL